MNYFERALLGALVVAAAVLLGYAVRIGWEMAG